MWPGLWSNYATRGLAQFGWFYFYMIKIFHDKDIIKAVKTCGNRWSLWQFISVCGILELTSTIMHTRMTHIIIPPANYVCGGVYCFHVVHPSVRPSVFPSVCLSIRPSVTFWFFFNILKRQWWKFIKFCRHIDIDEMYVYNRKLRARGQFCWSYCPL